MFPLSLSRQELLSAHERISLLQDHLAVTRLQSRGTTPLRPSPPDNAYMSSDHTHNHTSTTLSSTVISEMNHGRFSPTKTPSGSVTSASSISSGSNGPIGGYWSTTRQNSLGSSLVSGDPVKGGGGGGGDGGTENGTGSVSIPQRTSSFHGFNKGWSD